LPTPPPTFDALVVLVILLLAWLALVDWASSRSTSAGV
jgi:hypothetical protein